ncbi:hypothetical protein DFH29DRAFT_1000066 [Suillus ampliporus]|nr:hypothetical protein DFH29DRAFT_1000066 [Suillus ampliporus]
MTSLYCAEDFDADGNFISGGGLMDLLAGGEGVLPYPSGDEFCPISSSAVPSINEINWDDPSLYTMPLTSDEIAAITEDITATNTSVPPAHTPSPQPFETSTRDLEGSRSATEAEIPGTGEQMLESLRKGNTSSWAARNPTRAVICTRTPPPRLTEAQKATRKIRRDQKMEKTKLLHDAIAEYLAEQKTKTEVLACAHSITPKSINDIIGSQTNYHKSCKPQLTNALIHAKAKEMNADQPIGSRYTLAELHEMVANDPQTKNLTKEEKVAYIVALNEHRKQKGLSLDDLRIHTGIYTTLFIVRGHINNTIQSAMHGTNNTEDFWEDVYEHPMADFLRQYEQWACTQNQNLNERDSLETVQKQVHKLILHGLVAVTGKKGIVMNYNNYDTVIVEMYGVRLVGWPQGVKFISPSNIGMVGDIRKLRDALKGRTCYWKALTQAEIKAHSAELEARHSAGEVVCKPRKKRSDSGVPRKRKAVPTAGRSDKENQRMLKKAKGTPAQHRQVPKSTEFVESSNKEEDDDE